MTIQTRTSPTADNPGSRRANCPFKNRCAARPRPTACEGSSGPCGAAAETADRKEENTDRAQRAAPETRPRRRPGSREDEWSPGRMKGVTKPSWGGRFASKMRGESGMSTAEYAVGTLAAVAFAGILLKVLTSGTVQSALSDLIESALS